MTNKQTIHIVNGPNLNLLGTREPDIYGADLFEDYFTDLTKKIHQFELKYYQSNSEYELINYIQELDHKKDGLVLNAGAYTHTSIAIADAIKAVKVETVEVHISNVYKREKFRHKSYITPVSRGLISGFGFSSYYLAVQSFTNS